ncbi:MAG TPA: ATP-binding protein [Acidimicrobiales bacterium]|nr:ATP-binding protein [Acidimicrobiales bacterium]
MSTLDSDESLFDDPHTDARMRRTIPQFARLGALAVAVTAPFAAETLAVCLELLGIAAIAVLVAVAVSWRDLIDRLSRAALLALLSAYCVLIALAVGLIGDASSPYGFLYLLPVTFTAVFFVGWIRYALAIAAPLLDGIVVSAFTPVAFEDRAVRLVLFVLLAHFGAVVAETLREALRANRSLHTVLEASIGAPLDDDLARIGVDAALSVAGWDAGAIALLDGAHLVVPALRGVSPDVASYYRERPAELVEASIVRPVVEVGRMVQYDDLLEAAGADHPLIGEGIVSLAALPIRYRTELIGVLIVAHRSPRHLDDREHDRLTRVTDQLGLALGSAAAYRRETEVAEDLRALNRQKDEFLANVSHELRTPAAAIKLVASTLHRSWDRIDDEQRDEMLAMLDRRGGQLNQLIGNLLDEALSDAGMTRLALVDINWCEALARWAELATLDTGRAVTLHLPQADVVGLGDAVKLERVVVNLLSNAAKFSDPSTPIDLSLSVEEDDVIVTVADHGIGIPPEEHDRIFDRFHQVDGRSTRTVGGFGIGLSLTRHFVAAHGGSVSVASRIGRGTTFMVRVPRRPAAADAGARAATYS